MSGGDGADTLFGGVGDDTLTGGFGNDVLEGGAGIDILTGNDGGDFFFFGAPSDGVAVSSNIAFQFGGQDVITDFVSGTDKIEISNTGFSLGGSLINNTNFFIINSQFNGTNAGANSSTPHIVVDSTKTVYFDDDNLDPGYTVLAFSNNNAPVFSDVVLQ